MPLGRTKDQWSLAALAVSRRARATRITAVHNMRRWCPPRSETCPEGCKVYAGSLLIPAAVGAYSENGPVGATINPRRVRLIARRG